MEKNAASKAEISSSKKWAARMLNYEEMLVVDIDKVDCVNSLSHFYLGLDDRKHRRSCDS